MASPFSDASRWFAAEVQPHEAMLRAWLQSRFPAGCDLDDIVQESYLRVLRARERGELQSPKAFLFATARNLALDQIRHNKVTQIDGLVEIDTLAVLEGGEGIPRDHRPQPGTRVFDRSHPIPPRPLPPGVHPAEGLRHVAKGHCGPDGHFRAHGFGPAHDRGAQVHGVFRALSAGRGRPPMSQPPARSQSRQQIDLEAAAWLVRRGRGPHPGRAGRIPAVAGGGSPPWRMAGDPPGDLEQLQPPGPVAARAQRRAQPRPAGAAATRASLDLARRRGGGGGRGRPGSLAPLASRRPSRPPSPWRVCPRSPIIASWPTAPWSS